MNIRHKRGLVMNTQPSRQKGATLIEILIGLALSLIVTSSMVVLMSSSLGSATRITQMTQLTNELRNTMSLLTRDVRRANYNPYSPYCYSNSDCGVVDTASKVNFIADLDSVTYQGEDNACIVYFLERVIEEDGLPGDVGGGGFRWVTTDGIGHVEMWTGDLAPPADCSGNSWLPITDPGFINITEFQVTDDIGSLLGEIKNKDGNVVLTQRVRQVRVQIQGRLVLDETITRRVEDIIRVRNDFIQNT